MKQYSFIPLFLVILCQGCLAQPLQHQATYQWLEFENVRKDGYGKLLETPHWENQHSVGPNPDIATFYGTYNSYDSIRLSFTKNTSEGDLFKKTVIHSSTWKPQPSYGNHLFFAGTYIKKNLPGMYISFYLSADCKNMMLLHYTNPGNLNMVLFFSTDGQNILEKNGLIIDPAEEVSEAEHIEVTTH